jgi:pimeloyl-ACP methyl ester carboxylesterase
MHGEVANPWIIEFIPRLLADDLSAWGETAKVFVESCVAYPDDMPQLTKYAWIGGASGQHPQVRLHALPRGQDESALLAVKDKFPFLVLHGTMDKHVLGDKLEKFMHSNFKNVEFHMWDHCGHAPFFDRPEEFNKTTLEWVNKTTEVSFLSFAPIGLVAQLRSACSGICLSEKY